MIGTRDSDQPPLGKIARRSSLGRIVDQPVFGSRNNFHRYRNAAKPLRVRKQGGGAESELQPAPGRTAKGQTRVGANLCPVARKAARVMRQYIVFEGLIERVAGLAHDVAVCPAQHQVQPHEGRGTQDRETTKLKAQHRCREYCA